MKTLLNPPQEFHAAAVEWGNRYVSIWLPLIFATVLTSFNTMVAAVQTAVSFTSERWQTQEIKQPT